MNAPAAGSDRDRPDTIPVAEYLGRLGVRDPTIEFAGLTALHRAHLRRIPFENLAIHLGVPIELGPPAVDKIVRQRRGGYCYELNGSFAGLLRALGFDADLLEARVYDAGEPGIRFDHLCILVATDAGPVLADVGFGACFDAPLRFRPDIDQHDANGTFRIASRDEGAFDLVSDDTLTYRFDLVPHQLAEFESGNRFHQSPASHFSRAPICSRATDDGRVTLRGRTLIETAHSVRTETEVPPGELGRVLAEHFGIELDAAAVAALAGRC